MEVERQVLSPLEPYWDLIDLLRKHKFLSLLTQESSVTRFLLFMKSWSKELKLLSQILQLKKTWQLKFALVLTVKFSILLVEERKWI